MNYTPKVRPKTFGVFFMKYSHKQRLIIVNRVKQGEGNQIWNKYTIC